MFVPISSQDPSEMVFEYASCGFHFGAIVAMDVAIRKSLFVSAGADKFIRVWNYVSMAQEASREEDEDIASIALHPTGNIFGYEFKKKCFKICIQCASL